MVAEDNSENLGQWELGVSLDAKCIKCQYTVHVCSKEAVHTENKYGWFYN